MYSDYDHEPDLNSLNKLTELGNQAVKLGLIIGHGYHGEKYEILRTEEDLLFSPGEAIEYLEELISNH